MKREFLKDLGLTDEQIGNVITEHGKEVQETNSKLAMAEQDRDSFKLQITDCDNPIKELGKKVGNCNNVNGGADFG